MADSLENYNEILGVKGLTVLTTLVLVLVLVLQQSIENCSKVTATKERKLSLTNLDGSLIKPASSATTILKLCSLRLIMQFLICSVLSWFFWERVDSNGSCNIKRLQYQQENQSKWTYLKTKFNNNLRTPILLPLPNN